MSFLYNILPEYTRNSDILTDINAVGEITILKGFMDAIDTEIFEILSNNIRDILTFTDIDKIKDVYLPYFSYLLGYEWNYYLDINIQKSILRNILQIYKRKGTKFSFHFSLYRLDRNIRLYEPHKDIFVINKSYFNYGIDDYIMWQKLLSDAVKIVSDTNCNLYIISSKKLYKLDLYGNTEWIIEENEEIKDIKIQLIASKLDYIYYSTDNFIKKIDVDGNIIFKNNISNITCFDVDTDGNFYVISNKIYLYRYNNNGILTNNINIDSIVYDYYKLSDITDYNIYNITIDVNNNIYLNISGFYYYDNEVIKSASIIKKLIYHKNLIIDDMSDVIKEIDYDNLETNFFINSFFNININNFNNIKTKVYLTNNDVIFSLGTKISDNIYNLYSNVNNNTYGKINFNNNTIELHFEEAPKNNIILNRFNKNNYKEVWTYNYKNSDKDNHGNYLDYYITNMAINNINYIYFSANNNLLKININDNYDYILNDSYNFQNNIIYETKGNEKTLLLNDENLPYLYNMDIKVYNNNILNYSPDFYKIGVETNNITFINEDVINLPQYNINIVIIKNGYLLEEGINKDYVLNKKANRIIFKENITKNDLVNVSVYERDDINKKLKDIDIDITKSITFNEPLKENRIIRIEINSIKYHETILESKIKTIFNNIDKNYISKNIVLDKIIGDLKNIRLYVYKNDILLEENTDYTYDSKNKIIILTNLLKENEIITVIINTYNNKTIFSKKYIYNNKKSILLTEDEWHDIDNLVHVIKKNDENLKENKDYTINSIYYFDTANNKLYTKEVSLTNELNDSDNITLNLSKYSSKTLLEYSNRINGKKFGLTSEEYLTIYNANIINNVKDYQVYKKINSIKLVNNTDYTIDNENKKIKLNIGLNMNEEIDILINSELIYRFNNLTANNLKEIELPENIFNKLIENTKSSNLFKNTFGILLLNIDYTLSDFFEINRYLNLTNQINNNDVIKINVNKNLLLRYDNYTTSNSESIVLTDNYGYQLNNAYNIRIYKNNYLLTIDKDYKIEFDKTNNKAIISFIYNLDKSSAGIIININIGDDIKIDIDYDFYELINIISDKDSRKDRIILSHENSKYIINNYEYYFYKNDINLVKDIDYTLISSVDANNNPIYIIEFNDNFKINDVFKYNIIDDEKLYYTNTYDYYYLNSHIVFTNQQFTINNAEIIYVYKNNILLKENKDYKIDSENNIITLSAVLTDLDILKIIIYNYKYDIYDLSIDNYANNDDYLAVSLKNNVKLYNLNNREIYNEYTSNTVTNLHNKIQKDGFIYYISNGIITKKFFITNNGHFLTSKNYYSNGVISVKINKMMPEIFEIIENVRPAGWLVVIEGNYNLYYSFHDKTYKKINNKYTYLDDYRYEYINKFIENGALKDLEKESEDFNIQFLSGIAYTSTDIIPITMLGKTLFINNLTTLNHIFNNEALFHDDIISGTYPINLDLDAKATNYKTAFRNPWHYMNYSVVRKANTDVYNMEIEVKLPNNINEIYVTIVGGGGGSSSEYRTNDNNFTAIGGGGAEYIEKFKISNNDIEIAGKTLILHAGYGGLVNQNGEISYISIEKEDFIPITKTSDNTYNIEKYITGIITIDDFIKIDDIYVLINNEPYYLKKDLDYTINSTGKIITFTERGQILVKPNSIFYVKVYSNSHKNLIIANGGYAPEYSVPQSNNLVWKAGAKYPSNTRRIDGINGTSNITATFKDGSAGADIYSNTWDSSLDKLINVYDSLNNSKNSGNIMAFKTVIQSDNTILNGYYTAGGSSYHRGFGYNSENDNEEAQYGSGGCYILNNIKVTKTNNNMEVNYIYGMGGNGYVEVLY